MGQSRILVPELYYSSRLTHYLNDDFDDYTDTQRWTKLVADSGSSVANSDNADGQITITTGATNNNEAMLKSTRKNFLIAASKPIMGEFRINYAEAATNAANVAAGFSTVFGANLLLDDGAGPATTMDGALIYKVDGETVWRCLSSIATTQTITKSTTTAGGTDDQVLRIEISPVSATLAEVTFYVNGIILLDGTSGVRPGTPIKHTITYTGATKMGVGVYVKDGSGTGEVVNWDEIFACQTRA